MPATATDLIVEHDDARPRLQVVAAIGPQVGLASLAFAGVKLCDWCFIGMQRVALQQVPCQPVC